LTQQADRSELARDLAALWAAAAEEEWTWSRLQRRAMLRVFRDSDLMVVSGNDAQMHELAAPLYERLWQGRERLAAGAQSRVEALTAAGYHIQIKAPGMERFLHLESESRRLTWSGAEGDALPAPARLRPGVAARSLVQDWLFQPAAVVVGPAEVAYLKQLVPVYEEFDVPRSPLLPRLFAQLQPAGQKKAYHKPAKVDAETDRAVAQRLGGNLEKELISTLREQLELKRDRARKLAERESKRVRTSVTDLLARERRRLRQAAATKREEWQQGPRGQRQERSLASHWATSLWGEELVTRMLAAARQHFQEGTAGDWHEFVLTVPPITPPLA
jgi:uncharacterized protein YllA (UPF0747 family)